MHDSLALTCSHVLVTRNACSVSERGVGRLASTREGTTNVDSRTFETYYTSATHAIKSVEEVRFRYCYGAVLFGMVR